MDNVHVGYMFWLAFSEEMCLTYIEPGERNAHSNWMNWFILFSAIWCFIDQLIECESRKQSADWIITAVGQEVERSSTNQKTGGSIPGFSSPHVHVSLDKTFNPRIGINVYEWLVSLHGWMRRSVKTLWVVITTRQALYKDSPSTIQTVKIHVVSCNLQIIWHKL